MNVDIQIPKEVVHTLNERTKIWSEMDTAIKNADQLGQVAQAIGGLNGSAEEVKAPLVANTNDPRREIDQVINVVGTQRQELAGVEKEITDTRAQIAKIKSQAQMYIIAIIVAAIVIIGIIVILLSKH